MPSFVFATSGACSSHNGVNCAAGPNWNNTVTCNDGWTGSSVKYTSADECQDNISCTATQYQNLMSKYGLENTKNQIVNLNNQISSINSKAAQDIEQVPIDCDGECPSNVIYARQQQIIDQATTQINSLKSQILSLQTKLKSDIDLVLGECKAMGYDRINQFYLQALAKHNAEISQVETLKPVTQVPEIIVEPKIEKPVVKVTQPVVKKPAIDFSKYIPKTDTKKTQPIVSKPVTSTPTTTLVATNSPTPQIIKEPVKTGWFISFKNFFIKLFR